MTHLIAVAGLALGTLAAAAHADRVIVEDFDDGFGGAGFDTELSYDFGTASDFTGFGDTHDLFAGELWLYADLVTVEVSNLQAGEYISAVEVDWRDFCGIGCTELTVAGSSSSLVVGNAVLAPETVSLTSVMLGEAIERFSISSFEGRIDAIRVTVAPAPGSLALLGLGALGVRRRRA